MINMDRKLHITLTFLLYLGFATCYSLILFFHEGSIILPLSLLTVIVILATIRHVKYYRYDAFNPKAKVFIIVNMVLIFIFFYFNSTDFKQIFLLILIGDCIFAFSKAFSIKYIVGTYIVYYPYIYFMYKYKYELSYLDEAIQSSPYLSYFINNSYSLKLTTLLNQNSKW